MACILVHKTFSNFAEVGVACKTMYMYMYVPSHIHTHTHTHVCSKNNCLGLQRYPCSPKQEFSMFQKS